MTVAANNNEFTLGDIKTFRKLTRSLPIQEYFRTIKCNHKTPYLSQFKEHAYLSFLSGHQGPE